MTALKRRFAVAMLAFAIGAGIHQAWQAASLRRQVRRLQEQELAREEQLRQLNKNREEATSQLAGLRQENERLNRNASELLKLRAEAARLQASQSARAQANTPAENPRVETAAPMEDPEEATLHEPQRMKLAEMSGKVKTGNSVADLGRLKDSLKRWDELYITPAPPEWKPVFNILKRRVQERVAELELERQ